MNLCFLHFAPSKDLLKVLLKHFSVSRFESAESLLEDQAEKNLIAIKVNTSEDLKHLITIRKSYPHAWIAISVKKNQLNSSFHSKVLDLESKNDVWFLEDWEATIWFSLERWFQYQKLTKENRMLRKDLTKLSQKTDSLVKRFEHNLNVVENIQAKLAPKSQSTLSGVNFSAKYIPALGKGGDYYDLYEYPDNKRMGILLADASTHTMAAALLSVLFKLKLEEFTSRFQTSRSFVSHLCEELELTKAKSLAPMSLFYGILDRTALTFDFTSAGSISPLIWRGGQPLQYPEAKNPMIGNCASFPYREVKLNLSPGDLLVLHTDGLEAPLKQEGNSARDQLLSLIGRNPKCDPVSLRNDFLGLIDSYRSKKRLKDDLTFLNISIDERAMYLAR